MRIPWAVNGTKPRIGSAVLPEVKSVPELAPLPPHVTLKQAKHLTSGLINGDPRETNVVRETAKRALASLVPSSSSRAHRRAVAALGE